MSCLLLCDVVTVCWCVRLRRWHIPSSVPDELQATISCVPLGEISCLTSLGNGWGRCDYLIDELRVRKGKSISMDLRSAVRLRRLISTYISCDVKIKEPNVKKRWRKWMLALATSWLGEESSNHLENEPLDMIHIKQIPLSRISRFWLNGDSFRQCDSVTACT